MFFKLKQFLYPLIVLNLKTRTHNTHNQLKTQPCSCKIMADFSLRKEQEQWRMQEKCSLSDCKQDIL